LGAIKKSILDEQSNLGFIHFQIIFTLDLLGLTKTNSEGTLRGARIMTWRNNVEMLNVTFVLVPSNHQPGKRKQALNGLKKTH
jgi:hypothetical protein